MAYRQAVTIANKAQWLAWLKQYGAGKFFDAFIHACQYAKGTCVHCSEAIYLDIVEGGGVPDWRTEDGDYGCPYSPDTNEEGSGAHEPQKLMY